MSKLIENLLKLLEGVPKKWVVFLAFTAIIAGSPNFWPSVSSLFSTFQEPKMGQALALTSKTFLEMNRILSGVGADKVHLLRAHDSGRPRPGTKMFSSMVHEVWGKGSAEYSSRFQKQELDEPYINLLQKVYDEGYVDIITSQMPDSLLKNIYMHYGITQARLIKIHTTDNEIFYLGVVWRWVPRALTPKELDTLRWGSTSLTNIIKAGEAL